MKHNIFILFFCSAFLALIISCGKQEVSQPDTYKVVKLQIRGTSEVDLEYLYKDSVIATSLISSGKNISIDSRLLLKDEGASFQIRKKGSTEILQSKQLASSPYVQNFNVFYDGTKVYDSSVNFWFKGYVLSGELEFLLDGNVIYTKGAAVDYRYTTLMDKGNNKVLEVRKKGQTGILLTKTIDANSAQQDIRFFFDGTSIIDKLTLDPPSDPRNMKVTAKFETKYPTLFKNVDVDVIFYTYQQSTKIATKMVPEVKFTLSKDGTLSSIELPPLPGPGYNYTFDIFEKGTTNVPYSSLVSPLIVNGFPFKANDGKNGALFFEAGKSKLFNLKDKSFVVATPSRNSLLSGEFEDLSSYFQ